MINKVMEYKACYVPNILEMFLNFTNEHKKKSSCQKHIIGLHLHVSSIEPVTRFWKHHENKIAQRTTVLNTILKRQKPKLKDKSHAFENRFDLQLCYF